MSSTARQIVSTPSAGAPHDDPKKKKRLKKRVVPKADGRYLIYYEKSSAAASPQPALRAGLPAQRGGNL